MELREDFDCGLGEQQVSALVAGARGDAPIPTTPPKRPRRPSDFPPIFGDAT